jgi:hypothetical protein
MTPDEPRVLVRPAEVELTPVEITAALCAYSVLYPEGGPGPELDPGTVRDEIGYLVMLYGYGSILQAAAAMAAGAELPGRIQLWNQTPARLTWAARQAARLATHTPGPPSRPTQPDDCTCDGSGITPDDGTATGLTGWPLPCPCTSAIPARVRQLVPAHERTPRP